MDAWLNRLRAVIPSLVRPGFLLGGVALVGVGVSGLLSALMAAVFGAASVTGDIPGDTYTPDRCAQLLRLAHASTCERAAVLHHLDEVTTNRVAAGMLGLFVLGLWVWLRLTRGNRHRPGVLPERFTSTVGASLFLLAAALLILDGLGRLALGTQAGAGASLSGGIVSAFLGVAFAVAFLRDVPSAPPP